MGPRPPAMRCQETQIVAPSSNCGRHGRDGHRASSRVAMTWVTGIGYVRRRRFGRSSLSHRDTPGGSVETMISSNSRVRSASPTARSGLSSSISPLTSSPVSRDGRGHDRDGRGHGPGLALRSTPSLRPLDSAEPPHGTRTGQVHNAPALPTRGAGRSVCGWQQLNSDARHLPRWLNSATAANPPSPTTTGLRRRGIAKRERIQCDSRPKTTPLFGGPRDAPCAPWSFVGAVDGRATPSIHSRV